MVPIERLNGELRVWVALELEQLATEKQTPGLTGHYVPFCSSTHPSATFQTPILNEL